MSEVFVCFTLITEAFIMAYNKASADMIHAHSCVFLLNWPFLIVLQFFPLKDNNMAGSLQRRAGEKVFRMVSF